MKHIREVKVAVLAIVCLFLLYFGFSFLKGVNIFSPVHSYVGLFAKVDGLTEQAPVYVRGYKVGQVDAIRFDFTREVAFTVEISLDKHILLPKGSEMRLVSDGLMGGKAIEVFIPVGVPSEDMLCSAGDTLPTSIRSGLVESLQTGLLAHVDSLVSGVDSVVATLQQQLAGDHLRRTLSNVDRITSDLTVSAGDIRNLTHTRVPQIMDSAQTTVNNANAVLADLRDANLKGTIAKLDTTVSEVNRALTSTDGTVGLLLNDKGLYTHVDAAIQSVDSLVTDLKNNPKRYVHFSLFGRKESKKK